MGSPTYTMSYFPQVLKEKSPTNNLRAGYLTCVMHCSGYVPCNCKKGAAWQLLQAAENNRPKLHEEKEHLQWFFCFWVLWPNKMANQVQDVATWDRHAMLICCSFEKR